jgi:hypothetical protein
MQWQNIPMEPEQSLTPEDLEKFFGEIEALDGKELADTARQIHIESGRTMERGQLFSLLFQARHRLQEDEIHTFNDMNAVEFGTNCGAD